MQAQVTQRSYGTMVLLTIITFGLYFIYWSVSTKRELNGLGGTIPTSWLIIIPIANFYFWYRYSQAFVRLMLKRDNDDSTLVYFLMLSLLPLVGMFICQSHFNAVAQGRS